MISTHIDPFVAFCKDLHIAGDEVHLYRGPNVYGGKVEDFLPRREGHLPTPDPEKWPWFYTENVYFLAGVNPGLEKRAADMDVRHRGMFTLDFDIRKELEKKGIAACGLFDIGKCAEDVIGSLEPHPMWGKMRYVVMSGNGMHVHYFGEPCDVVKEEWSAGMKDVLQEIAKITPIPPDFGCCNAGRIMRMPGSWNVKDPSSKKPVDFIVWMPSYSLPPLQFIQERGKVAIARINQVREQERRNFIESGKQESDLIALINCIPIEQVVKQLLGCDVKSIKKDGGMRFGDEKGVERGFFKHHQHNIIVHEGTSLFPAPAGVGYNCLGLARVILGKSTHDTIEWFCERSPRCRDVQREERARWAKQVEEEESHEFIDLMNNPAIDEAAEAASFKNTISSPTHA